MSSRILRGPLERIRYSRPLLRNAALISTAAAIALLLLSGCGSEDSGSADTESDGAIVDGVGDVTADGADGDTTGFDADGATPDGATGDADSGALDADGDPQDVTEPIDIQDLCEQGLQCDDGDPCTNNGCHPVKGCQFTAKDCDDGNPCTTNACTPSTGVCSSTPKNCDDGNGCTTDVCDPAAGCKYTLISCDDSDPCTSDSCSPATGQCKSVPNPCSDGDPCTTDSCDPVSGCQHAPKEGPCCLTAADCDDGVACTQDQCLAGSCANIPIPNCCTSPADCGQDNPCLDAQCVSGKCFAKPKSGDGCCVSAAGCDDGDDCTLDGCADNQCRHEPTCCDAAEDCGSPPCTDTFCSEEAGCVHVVSGGGCCDSTAWAADFAAAPSSWQLANTVASVGWHLTGAPDAPTAGIALRYAAKTGTGYVGPGGPHKGTATSKWFAVAAGAPLRLVLDAKIDVRAATNQDLFQVRVQHATGTSIAYVKQSIDVSGQWTELSIPLSAFAGETIRLIFFFDSVNTPPATGSGIWLSEARIESDCAPLACELASDCDDAAAYSTDTCVEETGACHWTINPNWCDEVTPCDDGNPCTQNLCLSNACVYPVIGGCCLPGAACDDADPCTTDKCNIVGAQPSGTCANTPIPECCEAVEECNDFNPCTLDDCNLGNLTCEHETVPGCCNAAADCDDADPCTTESCVALSCTYQDICCDTDDDCDDGDELCTEDTCVDGSCAFVPTDAPGCCQPTVAEFHFDDVGESQWQFTNSAGPSQGWQVWYSAPSFQSATGALYYGDPAVQTFDFGGIASQGTATSPVLSLPAAQTLTLSLWARMDTEGGTTYDKLVVNLLVGGIPYAVWTKTSTTAGQWFQIQANVTAFGGQDAQIRLVFDTVDSLANNTLGVLIDDVVLSSTCAPSTCGMAQDCNDGLSFTTETCVTGTCAYVY